MRYAYINAAGDADDGNGNEDDNDDDDALPAAIWCGTAHRGIVHGMIRNGSHPVDGPSSLASDRWVCSPTSAASTSTPPSAITLYFSTNYSPNYVPSTVTVLGLTLTTITCFMCM